MRCGAALVAACANCGAERPEGAAFCPRCGHAFDEPQRDAAPDPDVNLRRFIPPELLGKLESAASAGGAGGERRTVTMLFSDLQGSTMAAEHLDPEEWAEIMNGAFVHLIAPVYRYEGTLARMMGDAILAFFGAPIGHEDDPERAVRAGLEIISEIEPYRQQVKQRWGVEFDVRVGINTGLVVVGAVGSDLRVEYTAMGDAVNVAARMEQTATPGTVRISDATRRLVEGLFDLEPLGPIDVKGRSEPVEAYRVAGARTRPDVIRGISGMRAPMIGRSEALDAFIGSLDEAMSGQGRIVSVTGEAGIGKSRLISEAREVLVGRTGAPTWIVAPALSYERAIPFAVVRRLVRRAVGVDESTDPAAVWQAIEHHVRDVLPGRVVEVGPYVGAAAGAALPDEFRTRLDYLEPDRLRVEIFRSVLELLEGVAERAPLVLVMEDLHWADSSSIDLTTGLMDLAERASVALVLAYRPRRHEPSWSVREAAERDHAHIHRIVDLAPLDETQSRELVSALLDVDGLPEGVRSAVLAKSEGNPFFIEEVIRSLIDRDLLREEDGRWIAAADLVDITIPDTLAAVITARLDSLDEAARGVVQSGSVLGREFRYDELAAVLDTIGGVDDALITLQRRGLVAEVARIPKRVFRFKHALTQEAIYETLLLRTRTELHARIARHLESIQPERADDIADHFLAARLPESALPFLVDAGQRALRTHAIPEAAARFERAVEIIDASTGTAPQVVRAALEGLGRAQEGAMDFPAAIETYSRLRSEGERSGDLEAALSGRNKAAFLTGMMLQDMDAAFTELEVAERTAREAQTNAPLAETCMYQCFLHSAIGEFDAVEHYMGEMARVGRELDDVETVLFGLTHLANTLAMSLKPDEAIREARRALALAEETGHLKWQCAILAEPLPLAHLQRTEIPELLEAVERGMEIALRIGDRESEGWAALFQGRVAMLRGDLEDALGSFRRADAAFQATGLPWVAPLGQCMVASCYERIGGRYVRVATEMQRVTLESLDMPLGQIFGGWVWTEIGHCALAAGDADSAEDLFRRAIDVPTLGRLIGRPEALRGLILLAIDRDDLDAATTLAAEYREFVEERSVDNQRPTLLMTEARLASAKGDHGDALARLDACVDALEGLEFRRLELDVQRERMAVLRALGDEPGLQAARSRFETIAAEITSGFRDDELRAAFSSSVTQSVVDRG
jgi:predicted ATPase/class 3 adenylate cyclase